LKEISITWGSPVQNFTLFLSPVNVSTFVFEVKLLLSDINGTHINSMRELKTRQGHLLSYISMQEFLRKREVLPALLVCS